MHKSSGFTLIEVIVAVLVLALGLIGLAALQATGVKNVQTAYNRSQAIHLAQDISDRIRANPKAAVRYADINNNGTPDISESSMPATGPIAACSQAIGCNQDQLAQTDLAQWRTALGQTLPLGCGGIVRGTGASNTLSNNCGKDIPKEVIERNNKTFTIVINWDENNNGQLDANDPNYMVSFELL